jgi:hypothetical protein
MMIENNDDHEDRTITQKIWVKVAKVLRTVLGKSIVTDEPFIIEIPSYLDDDEDGK